MTDERLPSEDMADDSTVFPYEDSEFPFDDIPDKLVVDSGLATLEIREISPVYSKAKPEDGKVAKKMILVKCQVVEPSTSAGMVYSNNFIFGTEEDPDAKQVETLRRQRGAVDFRQLLIAAKVTRAPGDKESVLFLRARGCRFVTEIYEDKGYTRNRGYFPVGTTAAQAGVRGGASPAAQRAPGALRPSAPAPVVAAETSVTCPRCEESVRRSAYGEHVRNHDAAAPSGSQE